MSRRRSFLVGLLGALLLLRSPALSLATSAPASASPSPQRLFGAGQFPQARDAYEALLKQNPDRPELNVGLIRTLLRLDDWQDAVVAGSQAMQNCPNNADIDGLCAIANFRAGQMDMAQSLSDKALNLGPNSYWALVAAGDIALWNDQQAKALSYYDHAARIDPKEPDAWFGILHVDEDVDNPEVKGLSADEDRAAKVYTKLRPKGYPHDYGLTQILSELQPDALRFSQKSQAHPPMVVSPLTEAELKRLEQGAGIFSTTVPIEVKNGQIWVQVKINGHTFHMTFDTGGEGVILSRKAIAQLKIESGSKTQAWGAQGALNQDNYIADSMQFGSLVIKPIQISAADTPAGDRDGVFGSPILDYFLITVDYQKKTMTLSCGKDAAPPDPSSGDTHIPIPFHYIRGKIILPVSIDSKAKWQPLSSWAVFDTGATSVYLSLPVAQRLSEGLAPEDTTRGTITSTVALGTTAKRIDWLAIKPGPYLTVGDSVNYVWRKWDDGMAGLSLINKVLSPQIGIDLSALLGEPYTEGGTRFTIDYRRHLLTIDYPSTPAVASPSNTEQTASPAPATSSPPAKQGS